MRQFFALILLLFTVPLTAQNAETVRVPVNIENTDIRTEGGAILLDVSGSLGTGCDEPVMIEQSIAGNTLFVELYQELPTDVVCPMILIAYDETITLESGDYTQIDVNGIPINLSTRAQNVPPSTSDSSTRQVDNLVDEVELIERNGRWALRITGDQPDGCDYPVMVDETLFTGNWLVIEIYREIPEDISCPEVLQPYEEIIGMAGYLPGSENQMPMAMRVEVNEYAGIIMPGIDDDMMLMEVMRQPLAIDRVTADVSDTVTLNITGQTDGCEVPYRATQSREGDIITVEVYRIISAAQACPAVLRTVNLSVALDGEFQAGTYDYQVNDVTGTFRVGAQGTRRVAHVVENVDVAVLDAMSPQIELEVRGYIPDGCEADTQVDITRQDDEVTVAIYRELPDFVTCPEFFVDFERTISLGAFEVGQIITIDVNGVITEVEL